VVFDRALLFNIGQ